VFDMHGCLYLRYVLMCLMCLMTVFDVFDVFDDIAFVFDVLNSCV